MNEALKQDILGFINDQRGLDGDALVARCAQDGLSVDAAWKFFHEVLREVLRKYTPRKLAPQERYRCYKKKPRPKALVDLEWETDCCPIDIDQDFRWLTDDQTEFREGLRTAIADA